MICQRVGCEHQIPPHRRKYCSNRCGKMVNLRGGAHAEDIDWGNRLREKCTDVKLRGCLVCGTIFTSQHSGNRICGPCSASGTHYTQKPPRTGARSCLGDGR